MSFYLLLTEIMFCFEIQPTNQKRRYTTIACTWLAETQNQNKLSVWISLRAVCPLFCACVRLELLLFNQDRQNLLTIFVSHESWPNFLLCYFCFQFQSHQKLANFATFTTQFCKQFQNDNSVTNMALKLKQKRLSGQCHLNFKVSFQLSHKFVIKNSV